jgi:photosystem II stability/assembly factor-like uncharacterized protein
MRTDKIPVGMFALIMLACTCLLPSMSQARNPYGCDLFAAAVVSDGIYIAVGDRGKIFRSQDAGKTFNAVPSKSRASLSSVSFPDARMGWIVGQGGVILHSSNGGVEWLTQTSGVNKYLMDVDFVDAFKGCAVGADSTVIVTADGGRTWVSSTFTLAKDVGGEYNLFAVKMLGPETICITGDMGRVFLSPDSGKTWSEAASPLYDNKNMEGRTLYAMAYSAGTLLAMGIDGSLVISKDKGKTWIEAESGAKEPEFFCMGAVDNMVMAAGSAAHIIISRDGGATWKSLPVPENVHKAWLSGIAMYHNSTGGVEGLVVGQYGTMGIIRDAQITWQQGR